MWESLEKIMELGRNFCYHRKVLNLRERGKLREKKRNRLIRTKVEKQRQIS